MSEQQTPITGIDRIAAERRRQIEEEGWTPEHDDTHESGELVAAAARLCLASAKDNGANHHAWGLTRKHGSDPERMLVIAGALIAAEIDRLQRAKMAAVQESEGGDG